MVESLQNALSVFLAYIPQLIGAIIILIVGYIVARILQTILARVLQAIGFDGWMERGGIKQFFDRAQTRETPATVLGKLVFWLVFIIAITMAADALGIEQVSQVLSELRRLLRGNVLQRGMRNHHRQPVNLLPARKRCCA
jgi:ABC-type multidrug transport system fused ATPase/permease subunit